MLYLCKFLRIIIIIGSTILTIKNCNAGGEFRMAGARSASLGNSSVALTDLWSAFNNQAALSGLTAPAAGFYYENRFMLKELGYKAAALAYPYKIGTVAVNFAQFGFEAWKENKVGLSYSKAFGNFIAIGVQLDYCMMHRDERYGDINYLTFEVGILSNITPRLILGAHAYNPLNTVISETTDERAPAVFRLGGAYEVTDKFIITAETEKDINDKVLLKSGIEYKLIPTIHLRVGITSDPSTFCFGIGVFYRKLTMDFSASYHQVLGFSPQTSVIYTF